MKNSWLAESKQNRHDFSHREADAKFYLVSWQIDVMCELFRWTASNVTNVTNVTNVFHVLSLNKSPLEFRTLGFRSKRGRKNASEWSPSNDPTCVQHHCRDIMIL